MARITGTAKRRPETTANPLEQADTNSYDTRLGTAMDEISPVYATREAKTSGNAR